MENLEHARSPEAQESIAIPDSYFAAYQEGNLRFPQQSLGIVLFVGDAVLKDPKFDPAEFAKTKWSAAQLEHIKEIMNRAHAARHIPVATAERVADTVSAVRTAHGDAAAEKKQVVPEKRFQQLWDMTKKSVLGAIATTIGVHGNDDLFVPFTPPSKVLIEELSEKLSDPEKRQEVERTFASFKEILNSPWGKAMASEIRNTMDNRRRFPNDSELQELDSQRDKKKVELFDRMVERYRDEGGEFDEGAKMIFEEHYL